MLLPSYVTSGILLTFIQQTFLNTYYVPYFVQ